MTPEPQPHPADSEPNAAAPNGVSSRPVPMWLLMVTLLLLFAGMVWFDQASGWFDPKVYGPFASLADVERFQPRARGGANLALGKQKYDLTCALCHGPDGAGKPGQAPPLAGADWVTAEGPNRLIHIVLYGLTGPIEVSGQRYTFSAGMTPFGSVLSDEDIAAILSYIRQAWGNKAAPVTPEQVQKVRAQVGNRTQPYTAEELLRLPVEVK
jgi:mono/diheme cytochrome c family protein